VENSQEQSPVFVEVVSVDAGRQIGWSDGLADRLLDRIDDVEQALQDGSAAVAAGLRRLARPDGWEIGEVTATFGISLAAEAGAIISKASGEATLEVSITYRRAG